MTADLLRQRFEIKYLIHRKTLERLHQRLSQYMEPDPHAADGMGGYFNHSVYLDSPRQRFYLEKHEGFLRRIKPRIRAYRPTPTGQPTAYFLELKGRRDKVVTKERVKVSEALARRLLQPGFFDSGNEAEASPVLSKFHYLVRRYGLEPRVTVLYHRRAFFSTIFPNLRITYDTRLQSSWTTVLDSPPSAFRCTLPQNQLVLEIKYTNKIPRIILREIAAFELQQATFSKYAKSVEANSAAQSNVLRNYF
jgi:hypothetical protein